MGLNKDGDSAGAVYLNVSEGKLIRNHHQPVDGVTKTRVNKNGKTVHEEIFSTLTGRLVDFKIWENDYGKQYQFLFEDVERFIVCMPYSSRYATAFLKILPNIDLSNDITIKPYSFIDKNDPSKKITGITVYQHNQKVLPAFTKDHPNGLPEMKPVKIKGATVWDTEEMDKFLQKKCEEKFSEVKTPESVQDDNDLPEFLK